MVFSFGTRFAEYIKPACFEPGYVYSKTGSLEFVIEVKYGFRVSDSNRK